MARGAFLTSERQEGGDFSVLTHPLVVSPFSVGLLGYQGFSRAFVQIEVFASGPKQTVCQSGLLPQQGNTACFGPRGSLHSLQRVSLFLPTSQRGSRRT